MNSYVLVVYKCFGGFDRLQDVGLIPSVSIGTASILEREGMMGRKESYCFCIFLEYSKTIE